MAKTCLQPIAGKQEQHVYMAMLAPTSCHIFCKKLSVGRLALAGLHLNWLRPGDLESAESRPECMLRAACKRQTVFQRISCSVELLLVLVGCVAPMGDASGASADPGRVPDKVRSQRGGAAGVRGAPVREAGRPQAGPGRRHTGLHPRHAPPAEHLTVPRRPSRSLPAAQSFG